MEGGNPMSIRVIRPGLLTTIQDLGRHGFQNQGVVVSGAMDPFSLRIANLLVGNDEAEGTLEITMIGPKLQFEEDSLIAICGGNLSPDIDGKRIPAWRPVLIKKGCVLSFGSAKSGCRAYLAVAGGFDIPIIMGSRSTYLRAGFGGFHGRSLKKGDILQTRPPSDLSIGKTRFLYKKLGSNPYAVSKWSVGSNIRPVYNNPLIRVTKGGEFDWFTESGKEQFFSNEFQVTSQSDRMGYRLLGPQLELSKPQELISEAVTVGTVQVPSDGNPIVLMADRQTTGGYPKIAQVVTVDLPVLAQVKPGEKIRFKEVSLEDAQKLLRLREQKIQLFKQGVYLKEKRYLGG
jgi:antagonist of KipI